MNQAIAMFCARTCLVCFCVVLIPFADLCAQSALPLLSGFDEERLKTVYPIGEEKTAGEAAKLVYRLQRVDLHALSNPELVTKPAPGNLYKIEGVIREIGTWPIPDRLVETLEFEQLQELVIETDDQKSIRVLTAGLAADVSDGDRIAGIGVVVSSDESENVVTAAGRLHWFPQVAPNLGITLLTRHGVDAAKIVDMATRDRLPLMAEDAEAFYSVLRAADEFAAADDRNVDQPLHADPVALLRDPNPWVGQWLRMKLDTVRVTRIAVTEPRRREQLGSDHYFQIDAKGELDNVVISIARAKDDPGDPIQFENHYPVSVAVKQLPAFLSTAIADQEGGSAISTMISRSISIDGFFLRLWSYDSEFMQRQGGGKQFGPLMIAAHLDNLEPTTTDPVGVRWIGVGLAVAVLVSIIGIVLWSRITAARDRIVERQRKKYDPEQIQMPDEPPT